MSSKTKIGKIIRLSAAPVFVTAAIASAQLLGYPTTLPKVNTPWEDTPYDSVLSKTWQGIKKRNIDAYTTGAVHRPKSETPGDAVSEGIGYGMLLALYMNDPVYFNKIWDAGEKHMFTTSETNPWSRGGSYYDWRINSTGSAKTGTGPASDADQDIALLLIFADQLAKNKVGGWTQHTSVKGATYASRARDLLNTIRATMVADNGALLPGHWGFDDAGTINPGYFAPAFYKVFAEFDAANKTAWESLVTACYAMIAKSPGYSLGLIPDWFNFEGSSTGGAGYNAYFDGDALYRDAIRVYWRLGADYLWYGDLRAKTFLDNAMTFIESKGGPQAANFFDMSGNLLPEDDIEMLKGGTIPRSRREHSHLTTGMWAAAAIGTGETALAQKYGDALLGFYQPGTNYWGHAVDPTGGRLIDGELIPEDTLHNEMYFDQFLAWFGASMLGGVFTNVWEDLKNGVPKGPPTWVERPAFSTVDIDPSDPNKGPMRMTAKLSHAVSFRVELSHDETGETVTFRGNSDVIDIVWHGLNENGEYMTRGFYWVNINAGGTTYRNRVWLGRPYANRPDLLKGNRLLVDDFADGNIYPYIGMEWGVHTRSAEGSAKPAGLSSEISPATDKLTWNYSLDGGSWRVAALDWNTGAAMDFSGGTVDTIIFTAGPQTAGLEVSVQLLAANFTASEDKYFEHVITMSSTSQTQYKIPLNAASWNQREYGEGGDKSFETTISQITGIRWHVQYDASHENASKYKSGSIVMSNMYLAGRNISRLYNNEDPPPYLEPPDGPISVKRDRARMSAGYSIRRISGGLRVTMPPNMSGATVSMINVKGRVVKRMKMSPFGTADISVKGLAAGMYFVEIKKRGVKTLRIPLGNIK